MMTNFLGVLLLLCAVSLSTAESVKKGQEKYNKVLKAADSSVITFTDRNYEEFALKDTRTYGMFVLFTASPGMGCQRCPFAEEEFAVLADSYTRQIQASGEQPEVFFGIAHFGTAKQAFSMHKLQHAPLLVYMPPTIESHNIDLLDLSGSRVYRTENMDAEHVSQFVKMQSSIKIEVYRSPYARIMITSSVIGLLTYFSKKIVLTVVPLARKTSTVWMVLSIGVFFVSVSGFIYCIIRNTPPMGVDPRTKKAMFFSKDGRGQYMYEGLFIGFLNVVAALMIIFMTRGPPKLVQRLLSKSSQYTWLTTLVGMGGFIICYRLIVQVYLMKTPWYMSQSALGKSVFLPVF